MSTASSEVLRFQPPVVPGSGPVSGLVISASVSPPSALPPPALPAYDAQACQELMRGGSKTFFAASLMLPRSISTICILYTVKEKTRLGKPLSTLGPALLGRRRGWWIFRLGLRVWAEQIFGSVVHARRVRLRDGVDRWLHAKRGECIVALLTEEGAQADVALRIRDLDASAS